MSKTPALGVGERLKGYELPRIWTPPNRELTPDTTDGFACIAFAEEILELKLFPWEKWLLIHGLELNPDWTYRFRTVIAVAARQNGKALDVDTPILTTDGWKTMGTVSVGHEVFHPDGHPTRVVGAFDVMHGHRCYEVTTTDGRSVIADADHLWTVKDRHHRCGRVNAWRTLTTRQLLDSGLTLGNGTELAYQLPRQQQIISKPVDLPIDPYALGAWLGDGCSLGAALSVGDQDLEAMRNNLLASGMQIVSEKRGRTCWKLGFNIAGAKMRNGFQSRAMKLGIWGPGNKRVPDIYLTAGTEQRKALLAGLLDTDGFISKAGQVGFTNSNEQLVDSVLYLARSLGWRAKKEYTRSVLYGRDCGPHYGVHFTPDESPFRLTRKSQRVTAPMRDRRTVSIKSIHEVASRPVRCIKVDRPDGLFLAGEGLMATHNTLMLVILALWHIYAKGSRTVIATAQDLGKAEDTWSAAVEFAQENEQLNDLIRKISLAHPKVFKVLNPQIEKLCEYRVATASRRGGRGFTGDLVLLDELREHQTWDSWAAITKTMMARPRAQCWCFSNAADALGIVLRYERALAHRDLGWPDADREIQEPLLGGIDPGLSELIEEYEDSIKVGFFEWSAPPKASRTDKEAWAQSNPSMNHIECVADCITDKTIASALYSDPIDVFDTEVICRQIDTASGGPFPADSWANTSDDAANNNMGEKPKPIVCVEVSTERAAAFIAKAAVDKNGCAVVGIVEAFRGLTASSRG